MAKKIPARKVHLIGVALEGLPDLPLIVFKDDENDHFLSLETDLFDIDYLIHQIIDEGQETAVTWLVHLLPRRCSYKALLTTNSTGEARLLLSGSPSPRGLPQLFKLGEGIALAQKLGVELCADPKLFEQNASQLSFQAVPESFGEDFLFLDSPGLGENLLQN